MSQAGTRAAKDKNAFELPLVRLLGDKKLLPEFNKDYGSRRVLDCRYIDQAYFNSKNIVCHGLLSQLGMGQMLANDTLYSPSVVRAFYFNLTIKNRTIRSSVRGVNIVVTENDLSRIMGFLPPEGPMFSELPLSLVTVANYDRGAIYTSLTGEPEPPQDPKIKVTHLPFETRMLHYLVAHCILNKSGNYSYANEAEQYIMYCAKNNIRFNVPYFIMKRMANVTKKNPNRTTPLPYATLVTKLIRAYHILAVEQNEISRPLLIDAGVISRMGYMDYHGNFERKRPRPARDASPEEEEEMDNLPGDATEESPAPTQLVDSLGRMMSMMTHLDSKMDAMHERLSVIDNRLDRLDIKVNTIEELISIQMGAPPGSSSGFGGQGSQPGAD